MSSEALGSPVNLHTTANGWVSSKNSSETRLAANAEFLGTAEDVLDSASISVFVHSDVSSAALGLEIQWSVDGRNWDWSDRYLVTPTPETHPIELPVRLRYVRIVYTNGVTVQTEFRLHTIFHKRKTAEWGQAKVTGEKVVANHDAMLLVRPHGDFYYSIAHGLVSESSAYHAFGRNEALTTDIEDVWTRGGVYTWSTAPETLTLVSTSADDTLTGAGVRSVMVFGLAPDFSEQSELVSMNGTVPVTTSKQYIRFHCGQAYAQGTYQTTTTAGGPGGVITINGTVTGKAEGELLPTFGGLAWDYNKTQLSRFTVPANKSACMTRLNLNTEARRDKGASFAIWGRERADIITGSMGTKRLIVAYDGVDGNLSVEHSPPEYFPEKTDIWVSAAMVAGSGAVTANFELVVTSHEH